MYYRKLFKVESHSFVMDQITLNDELLYNISSWMQNKYAATTLKQRHLFLKRIIAKYPILNKETLKSIMKGVKYQHQRAVLVMINDYCYDNDIDFDIKIPRVKAQANKLPSLLSKSEIELMIKATPYPYNLAIRCIFNFGAGLRISEIIKMAWDDIAWVDWLPNQDMYGVVHIKSGKGSKDRVVNIPTKLMKDLYEYAKEQNVLNEFRIPTGSSIFPFGTFRDKTTERILSYKGESMKREFIQSKYNWFRYNILQKCCEKAINKKIKIHSLRHSRATYLHEFENVPIEDLQLLLGHKSLNTTMIYTKVNPRSVFQKLQNTSEI